jgi:hypothetical protein
MIKRRGIARSSVGGLGPPTIIVLAGIPGSHRPPLQKNRTIKRSASGKARGDPVTELEKGAFHYQEQNRGNGVNA